MSRVAPRNRFEQRYTDLASNRLGGGTLTCTDDFFAEMENLLKPEKAVFIEDKYTDRGKWMDGWESRRRRFRPDGTTNDGYDHDHCTIQLGVSGVIHGLNIDTSHFLGNSPQRVSVEACNSSSSPDESTNWTEILSISNVEQDHENLFDIDNENVWTHVRLHTYPDGGVARFRVYGNVVRDINDCIENGELDLAFIKNGARPVICSDMFFSHMENLIMPNRGANMGDGWETKRRRPQNDPAIDRENDWLILKLATRGSIQKALVDTCHFKGNFPDAVMLEGADLSDHQACDIELLKSEAHENALVDNGEPETIHWQPILERSPLQADHEHYYEEALKNTDAPFTHVRVKMYPDGGISRLRLWGQAEK